LKIFFYRFLALFLTHADFFPFIDQHISALVEIFFVSCLFLDWSIFLKESNWIFFLIWTLSFSKRKTFHQRIFKIFLDALVHSLCSICTLSWWLLEHVWTLSLGCLVIWLFDDAVCLTCTVCLVCIICLMSTFCLVMNFLSNFVFLFDDVVSF